MCFSIVLCYGTFLVEVVKLVEEAGRDVCYACGCLGDGSPKFGIEGRRVTRGWWRGGESGEGALEAGEAGFEEVGVLTEKG